VIMICIMVVFDMQIEISVFEKKLSAVLAIQTSRTPSLR
jgi:hypothetical protein